MLYWCRVALFKNEEKYKSVKIKSWNYGEREEKAINNEWLVERGVLRSSIEMIAFYFSWS